MRVLGVLDRTVARQVMTPSAMGFVTYTFLLVMQGLFSLAEQIFVRGLPVRDAAAVLAATLPQVMVLTIPMGFLFGALLAVGRMNADNELLALQAAGISMRRLVLPVIAIGLILTSICGALFMVVIPRANRELRELQTRLFTSARNIGRIEPQVFYEDFPNLLLYVRAVDPDSGTWFNVLAYDSSDPVEERLTLARRGRVVSGGAGGVPASGGSPTAGDVAGSPAQERTSEPWILLEDVVTHQFLRDKPDTYRVSANQTQLFRPRVQQVGVIRYNVPMRERDTAELVAFLRGGELSGSDERSDEQSTADLRLAQLELHRRLALPAACVVFALLALPLGIGSRAGGRGRGFVMSICVVLAYYVLSNHGELLALEGSVPVWLGIWFPNLMLAALALVLMPRMGRWLGERDHGRGLVARAVSRWREWRREARRRSHRDPDGFTGSIPIALQRRRPAAGFPTLLDRYLGRRLIAPLMLVLASTAALYIVVDLTDRIDDIGKNDAPLEVVVAYYWNLVPQILVDVIPFALLIGVLILLTVLERQQELTALKGAGISLLRVALPVLLIALLGVSVMWTLSESIVPRANRTSERLLDRIKGRTTTRSYRTTSRQWLLSRDGTTFYNFLQYDIQTRTLVRFTMYRMDPDMRLTFNLFAHRVQYLNGAWIADSGWYRRIEPDASDEFYQIQSPMELAVPEGPNYFGQEYRRPSEMSHGELRAYIAELVESGYMPHQLLVRWHQKFSYPLSAFVMVCLALPFGLNRGGRRVTNMQGIAVALALGIGYFLMVAVFGKLAEAAVLPPGVGAWAPVGLALLFAVNRMTTLRT